MRYYLMHVMLCGLIMALGLLLLACSGDDSAAAEDEAPAESDAAPAAQLALRVLVLGDSLTAGYGVGEEEAFPQQLEDMLQERGLAVRVLNAGVSGDTLADGRERLDWVLQQEVDWVLLALGANDGLRGLDPQVSRQTLDDIIRRVQARGIPLMLAGMDLPGNYGEEYRQRFVAMFADAAADHNVAYLPFLLQGVAMQPQYNLADGIHPNVQGHARIARTVADAIEPLLRETLAQSASASDAAAAEPDDE